MSKKNVLFLCTHNAARSQMAEGLLRTSYGDHYNVQSAGSHPTQVHPLAIQVMKEIGIDISHHRSKSIDEFRGSSFDVIVTVCDHAKESCPFFPGKNVLHRGFYDPSSLEEFQKVRDEIQQWITDFFGIKKNNKEGDT